MMDSLWSEYAANGANQSYVDIQSTLAKTPKWVTLLSIGPGEKHCYASPSLDQDGTIYVGVCEKNPLRDNCARLCAVSASGQIKWKLSYHSEDPVCITMASPPTVVPSAGNPSRIYYIVTYAVPLSGSESGEYENNSHLYCALSTGQELWKCDMAAFAGTSAPKIYKYGVDTVICIHAVRRGRHLLILVTDNGSIVYEEKRLPVVRTLGSTSAVWEFFRNFFTLKWGVTFDTSALRWYGPFWRGLFINSIAVIPHASPFPDHLVVAYDGGVRVFQVELRHDQTLVKELWKLQYEEPVWDQYAAAGRNAWVLVARANGTVRIYDANGGREIGKYDCKDYLPAPPTTAPGNVYLTSCDYIHCFDYTGARPRKRPLPGLGTCSGVMVTNSACYVNTREGLAVFDLDLRFMHITNERTGGMTTPVAALDGTVYVAGEGLLIAYGQPVGRGLPWLSLLLEP